MTAGMAIAAVLGGGMMAMVAQADPALAQEPFAPASGQLLADQEVVAATEAADSAAVVASIEATVNAAYKALGPPARRDAHAKAHGCVKARFQVLDGVPSELRFGVFAKPRAYPAWIRFSNGNGTPHDDHAGDGRGMAIKLMGVQGPKLLEDEAGAETQDFVMINYPAFFVANVHDYVDFTRLSGQNKSDVFFTAHPRGAAVSSAITSKKIDQVLEQRYFSMTPYRLGARYIKFSARPMDCASGAPIKPTSAAPPPADFDYVRKAMVGWLAAKAACFDFALQAQTDPADQPVEDPTVVWDEAMAPFVTVATIRIPVQQFDTNAQQAFCENLSYTPWHSLADDRPAGGINRVRKAVYRAISTLRHRLNGAPRTEPTADRAFDEGKEGMGS